MASYKPASSRCGALITASLPPPRAPGAPGIGGGGGDAAHAAAQAPPAPKGPQRASGAARFVNAPATLTVVGGTAAWLASGKLGATSGSTLGAHVVTAGEKLGSSFGDRFIVSSLIIALALCLSAKK